MDTSLLSPVYDYIYRSAELKSMSLDWISQCTRIKGEPAESTSTDPDVSGDLDDAAAHEVEHEMFPKGGGVGIKRRHGVADDDALGISENVGKRYLGKNVVIQDMINIVDCSNWSKPQADLLPEDTDLMPEPPSLDQPGTKWKASVVSVRAAILDNRTKNPNVVEVVDRSYLEKKCKTGKWKKTINCIALDLQLNEEQHRAYSIVTNHVSSDSLGHQSVAEKQFWNVSIITSFNADKDAINMVGSKRFAAETNQTLTDFFLEDLVTLPEAVEERVKRKAAGNKTKVKKQQVSKTDPPKKVQLLGLPENVVPLTNHDDSKLNVSRTQVEVLPNFSMTEDQVRPSESQPESYKDLGPIWQYPLVAAADDGLLSDVATSKAEVVVVEPAVTAGDLVVLQIKCRFQEWGLKDLLCLRIMVFESIGDMWGLEDGFGITCFADMARDVELIPSSYTNVSTCYADGGQGPEVNNLLRKPWATGDIMSDNAAWTTEDETALLTFLLSHAAAAGNFKMVTFNAAPIVDQLITYLLRRICRAIQAIQYSKSRWTWCDKRGANIMNDMEDAWNAFLRIPKKAKPFKSKGWAMSGLETSEQDLFTQQDDEQDHQEDHQQTEDAADKEDIDALAVAPTLIIPPTPPCSFRKREWASSAPPPSSKKSRVTAAEAFRASRFRSRASGTTSARSLLVMRLSAPLNVTAIVKRAQKEDWLPKDIKAVDAYTTLDDDDDEFCQMWILGGKAWAAYASA
ncbi:hypothetical protein FPV67DRAFT_1446434 [Lyophyllum atratum]|nr:hypothetical protein FPV67DRAFT_1446434 [Lyophyllum atratum]